MDPKKMKSVYAIIERNGKSYWKSIGVGFVNSDGSWNLKLDTFPLGNGTIQVRDYEPRDEKRADDNGGFGRRGSLAPEAASG